MENKDSILDIYFRDSSDIDNYGLLELEIEENFMPAYKKYVFLEDSIFDNFEPEKINMKLSYGIFLEDTRKLEKILGKYSFVQKYNITYLDDTEDNDYVELKISRMNSILAQTAGIISVQSGLAGFQKYIDYEKQDEYKDLVEKIGKYRETINKVILNSRVVDLKEEVRKIEKIIWDYSKIINKDIDFNVKGLKINFDRYIFYKIKDHIINVFVNSIIYGIESRDERLLYEKNEKGQLSLTFKQEFGEIVIEMLDDGQGIDEVEIFQRAEEAGMVDINKKYTKEEILNLVFKPEMSLTNKKDENKERDLTLSNFYNTVEELGGQIKIESKKTQYTLLTARIPLKFILTETLLIKSGNVNYAIPFSLVEKTIKTDKVNFSYISDSTYYMFENEEYLVLQIPEKFKKENSGKSGYGIILNISGEKYIFLADHIGGIEEVVPQKINVNNKDYKAFLGAAILKNDEIALVLDMKNVSKNMDFLEN
jgi:two-component system chemotaxis sensor kinase CheA